TTVDGRNPACAAAGWRVLFRGWSRAANYRAALPAAVPFLAAAPRCRLVPACYRARQCVRRNVSPALAPAQTVYGFRGGPVSHAALAARARHLCVRPGHPQVANCPLGAAAAGATDRSAEPNPTLVVTHAEKLDGGVKEGGGVRKFVPNTRGMWSLARPSDNRLLVLFPVLSYLWGPSVPSCHCFRLGDDRGYCAVVYSAARRRRYGCIPRRVHWPAGLGGDIVGHATLREIPHNIRPTVPARLFLGLGADLWIARCRLPIPRFPEREYFWRE